MSSEMETEKYKFIYSVTLDANKVTRISLSFLKKITSTVEYGISNLNLTIYDSLDNPVASSSTSRNNVEIVEFTPTQSGNYTICVENVSSSTSTIYGIAWIQYDLEE